MSSVNKLYKRTNYMIQKSINLECTLYTRIKELVDYEYDATISDIVNICIEDYVEENHIIYHSKPDGEIANYRSVMIRKENLERLNEINQKNRNVIYKISKSINKTIFR